PSRDGAAWAASRAVFADIFPEACDGRVELTEARDAAGAKTVPGQGAPAGDLRAGRNVLARRDAVLKSRLPLVGALGIVSARLLEHPRARFTVGETGVRCMGGARHDDEGDGDRRHRPVCRTRPARGRVMRGGRAVTGAERHWWFR